MAQMRSLSSHAAQPLSSQTSLVHLLDTQTFCRPTSRSIVLYSIYILSHAVARSLSTSPRLAPPLRLRIQTYNVSRFLSSFCLCISHLGLGRGLYSITLALHLNVTLTILVVFVSISCLRLTTVYVLSGLCIRVPVLVCINPAPSTNTLTVVCHHHFSVPTR